MEIHCCALRIGEMDDLRVGRAIYHLEPEPTRRLMDYCMENEISMTNLLLMGLRTHLSKMNDGEKRCYHSKLCLKALHVTQ